MSDILQKCVRRLRFAFGMKVLLWLAPLLVSLGLFFLLFIYAIPLACCIAFSLLCLLMLYIILPFVVAECEVLQFNDEGLKITAVSQIEKILESDFKNDKSAILDKIGDIFESIIEWVTDDNKKILNEETLKNITTLFAQNHEKITENVKKFLKEFFEVFSKKQVAILLQDFFKNDNFRGKDSASEYEIFVRYLCFKIVKKWGAGRKKLSKQLSKQLVTTRTLSKKAKKNFKKDEKRLDSFFGVKFIFLQSELKVNQ